MVSGHAHSILSWRLKTSKQALRNTDFDVPKWDLYAVEFYGDAGCEPKSKIPQWAMETAIAPIVDTADEGHDPSNLFDENDSTFYRGLMNDSSDSFWIGLQFHESVTSSENIGCIRLLQRRTNFAIEAYIQEYDGVQWINRQNIMLGAGWSQISVSGETTESELSLKGSWGINDSQITRGVKESFFKESDSVGQSKPHQSERIEVVTEFEIEVVTEFESSSGPSRMPSYEPSRYPSSEPSGVPSDEPSISLSSEPSRIPSDEPSRYPSIEPSRMPSDVPSLYISSEPSGVPSDEPSRYPSIEPSRMPSDKPAIYPSSEPSRIPSDKPSRYPSIEPSRMPSSQPSLSIEPSLWPSDQPSLLPSKEPSKFPSRSPTNEPSLSLHPSREPSRSPSSSPSVSLNLSSSLQCLTILCMCLTYVL